MVLILFRSVFLPAIAHKYVRLWRASYAPYAKPGPRSAIQLEPALPNLPPYHRVLLPLKRLPRLRTPCASRGGVPALRASTILGEFPSVSLRSPF